MRIKEEYKPIFTILSVFCSDVKLKDGVESHTRIPSDHLQFQFCKTVSWLDHLKEFKKTDYSMFHFISFR